MLVASRSGGTGRRPGLKIPWVVIPVPVRFRPAAEQTRITMFSHDDSRFVLRDPARDMTETVAYRKNCMVSKFNQVTSMI